MTCEINETTIPLIADTTYYGEWSGFGDIHTYKYSMSENETITFRINIQQQLTAPNATLQLYRVEHDGTITSLGISYLRNYINVFEYDAIVGDYYFCLESIYNATYDLLVEFTDYTGVLLPVAEGYTGEIGESFFEEPEAICQEEIGYRLLSGDLPTGIKFLSSGNIIGTAEEQDCDSRIDEVPSWNWKQIDNQEFNIVPTAKEFIINVQAYFVDHPYVKTNKRFKVCVHNNWDLDDQTDNILNFSRKEYDITYVEIELDPTGLCPCTGEEEIITERIVNFSKNVSDDWTEDNNQLDKLTYEKQCLLRHDIDPKEDVYIEPIQEDVALPDTLCPICPNDK